MAVKSTVNYLAPMALWDDTKPYEITGNVSADVPRTNFRFEPHVVEIQDARALPSKVSLSTYGFEWVAQTTTEDFKTDDSVTRYINELEEFIQDHFKADKVLTFQYQVRKRQPDRLDPRIRPPSNFVHVDVSPAGAEARIRFNYPEVADDILRRRHMLLSLWRPLFSPLQDYPLALCDARSVNDNDLIESDYIYPNFVSESFLLNHSPEHKWFYLSDQRKDELLMITNYDSAFKTRTPHTGFELTDSKENTRARESIEVKVVDLVLTDGSKVIVRYGDHADALSRMCASLTKAKDFAASEKQESYLSKLISFYQTGDIDTHKEASKDWLADETPCVETWSGFLEPGRDPSGVRCEFEALVAVQNKKWSAAFDQLSSRAEKFILQLPWSGLGPDGAELGPFENESIIKPNFVALNLLCYCASNVWTGLTAPGYPDIKADFGRKNLTFSNRVAANNSSAQEHRFLSQNDIEVFEANRSLCFFLQLALHELIGHGCGKLFQESESGSFNFDRHHMPKNPFTDKHIGSWYGPGETPETAFSGIATAYIECLAEGIGLYLMSADGVLSTLAPDTTSDIDDVVYCGYLSIACMGLRSLLSYDPGMKARIQIKYRACY
ncbi:hypothetical protein H9Q70_001741 [Fusarium xylarioides]|nr:hypothetical protein H9Q70_001741 [Fusarium xylarioides]